MMERIKRKSFLFGSLVIFYVLITNALTVFGACSSDISNWSICQPSMPTPKLPPAGDRFTDPTFGTEIIRVTDETEGKNANVAYSYWNLFNADSTKFFISIDNKVFLYDFDKLRGKISRSGSLFPGESKFISFEGIVWSSNDPDMLYGLGSRQIYQYNVITHKYKLVKDFSPIWPETYLWQMSMSEDENVFAFTFRRASDYTNMGCGWYKVSTDSCGRWDTLMDECQVDKGGRYLYVHKGHAGGVVWDICEDERTVLGWNRRDHPVAHYDQGYGKILGSDPWSNNGFTYTIRSLSNPKSYSTVFDGRNWGVDSHVSWRNNDEEYAYVSNYAVDKLTNAPLENEIIQIFLDGSGRFRRLAHHRSVYNSYFYSPRASVDRLGRYIIFSSNWDSSGRRDVFILKIPTDFQASDPKQADFRGETGVR
jgi:hypothetical protein